MAKEPRAFRALIPDAVGKAEMLRATRATRALRQWPSVVGPLLASKSQPERYEEGTVWVAVADAVWAQELRMAKDTILQRLNQAAGEDLFKSARFGVRKVVPPSPAPEPKTLPDYDRMTLREITERRRRLLGDREP